MDALLEQAFKQFCEPLVITDIESKVIIANDAFFAMTGYTQAELIGQSLKILQGPETNLTIIQELRECLQSGRVFDGSIINYRKDGTRYRVHLTVSAVIIDGKITHYISRQKDISNQHCRELELLAAARIDLLTKLYNRNYGQRHFEETFAEYRRMNRPFSIFCVILIISNLSTIPTVTPTGMLSWQRLLQPLKDLYDHLTRLFDGAAKSSS